MRRITLYPFYEIRDARNGITYLLSKLAMRKNRERRLKISSADGPCRSLREYIQNQKKTGREHTSLNIKSSCTSQPAEPKEKKMPRETKEKKKDFPKAIKYISPLAFQKEARRERIKGRQIRQNTHTIDTEEYRHPRIKGIRDKSH